MTKKYLIICAASLFALITLFKGYKYLNEPSLINLKASYAYILSDAEAAKKAKHIVVGKVNKVQGYDLSGFMPKTFFEVQVVENLKGNLGDKFIFRQDGAIDEKNNEKIIIENYDLLSPGQTYLFFLDKVPDKNNTYWSINGPFSVY